jgi:hypothetical protein
VTDSFWRDPPWRGGKGGYRMALHPIEAKDWLPDRIDEDERDRKLALLGTATSSVFAALDDSLAGQQKILAEVQRVAGMAEPTRSVAPTDSVQVGAPYRTPSATCQDRRGDAEIDRTGGSNASVGASPDRLVGNPFDCGASANNATLVPIVRASLLVPDDLCLMEELDGRYRLTAACVCAPSYWRLAEKIGRTLDGIHAPVPTLNAKLAPSMQQFFARLSNDAVFERRNWLIHTNAELYQPVSDIWRRIQPHEVAALVVRTERQTLKRLDATRIVFTIRVTCHPLGEIAEHREAARDLLVALRALDQAERAAKGYDFFAAAVIDYLSRIARTHS